MSKSIHSYSPPFPMNMKYQEVQILDAEKSYASTLSNSEACLRLEIMLGPIVSNE